MLQFCQTFARACALLQCMVGSGLLWGLWSSLTLLNAWKTSALGLNYSLLKLLHLFVMQQAAWEPWQSQFYQEAFRNAVPFPFPIMENKLYSWEFRQYGCLGSKNNFFFLNERFLVFRWLEKIFLFQIFDFWWQKLCFDHPFLCFYLRHQSVLSMFFVCLCSFLCLFLALFPGQCHISSLRVHLSSPLFSSCQL